MKKQQFGMDGGGAEFQDILCVSKVFKSFRALAKTYNCGYESSESSRRRNPRLGRNPH